MDDSKIVIIGGNGQLGRALQAQYPNAKAVDMNELDITSETAVRSYDWSDTTIILNGAAYTNVDGSETPEGRVTAWQANAAGVANLAALCREKNLTLVHISSDYVFDGSKRQHVESEPFSPLNVYGASKAAGDIAAASCPKHYILRTSWVIGEGKNFVRTMLDIGKKGVDPTVVSDQIGRPTFTSELVRAIDHLLTSNREAGTYNVTNDGDEVNWAELARITFSEADLLRTVTGTTTAEYFAGREGIAPRPLHSTLDLAKLHTTGFASRDWRDDLHDYITAQLAADAELPPPADEPLKPTSPEQSA